MALLHGKGFLSHTYTERKKFSKFFTLVFVYKSMSLKRFRIEELCPSIDSMISLFFFSILHYVIVNLNVNENYVQYVHCKTDDPRGSPSI